jgi:signal peptidase I
MDDIDQRPATTENSATGRPGEKIAPATGSVDHKAADSTSEPAGQVMEKPQTPPPAAVEKPKAASDRESLIETVKTVVYALLIALVIRTFFFQPFNIPSGSMEATLLVGDYLFVEKFAYGYSQYSFPWGLGPISGRIWAGDGPKRGDVVVFKLPRDNYTDYIKRVIGLPGDRIQLVGGQVYLNDKPIPRARVSDYVETDPLGIPHHVVRYRETLPGGKSYLILARDPALAQNDTQLFVVPPGHYFMMGDNRDNSEDSRFAESEGGVGYVPAVNLVGKAEFIFFSNDGPLWELWRWPWSVRFSRMFTVID